MIRFNSNVSYNPININRRQFFMHAICYLNFKLILIFNFNAKQLFIIKSLSIYKNKI